MALSDVYDFVIYLDTIDTCMFVLLCITFPFEPVIHVIYIYIISNFCYKIKKDRMTESTSSFTDNRGGVHYRKTKNRSGTDLKGGQSRSEMLFIFAVTVAVSTVWPHFL